ncbi:MAG: hypothetical protein ABFC54_12905, partial [Thermoguttaceae bacterium]
MRRTIALACVISLYCAFLPLTNAATDSKKPESPKTEQRTSSTPGKSRRHHSVEEKRLSAPKTAVVEKSSEDAKKSATSEKSSQEAKKSATVEKSP